MSSSGPGPGSFSGSDRSGQLSKGPLGLLSRVARGAGGCPGVASLPLQFGSEMLSLAEFLWIRGEARLEHYYAEAVALACLRPVTSDIRRYEFLLVSFIRYDRRRPLLPTPEQVLPLNIHEQQSLNFLQLLRTQSAFQAIYESALQLETYGAMSRTPRKVERLILLSREMTAQPLLAAITPHEQMYFDLAITRNVV